MLLRPQDTPRPADPDPPDEVGGAELVVLHGVAADEGACAAQAGFAVHGDGGLRGLCELEEFVDDLEGGGGAVYEVHLNVPDAVFCEGQWVVGFFI